MAPVVTPYIPSYITVHLGSPSSNAANVTVSFTDYIKNVASSEIYPTWEPSALRANVLAIISFALNRVYTEFYRSRGYAFEITSSTAYDQNFVYGRNFFDSIVSVVDDLFDSYLRRSGFVEPLAAKFCNGTTVTCEGLSQWGSQYLARQGYSSVRIIQNYYGTNTEIVTGARVQGIRESYPGTALQNGVVGPNVIVIQQELNRISQNYPAIPKVTVDGIFGRATENAVRVFQQIFGLTVDGIVGRKTWYELVRLYVAVLKLNELWSEGQRYYAISWTYPVNLSIGDRGIQVRYVQYMLSIVGQFISSVPVITVDGIYGTRTRDAVFAFQRYAELPQTGAVNRTTWDALYNQYAGISGNSADGRSVPASTLPAARTNGNAPSAVAASAIRLSQNRTASKSQSVTERYYERATKMTQYPGFPLHLSHTDVKQGGKNI